jgi:hypothetical protein
VRHDIGGRTLDSEAAGTGDDEEAAMIFGKKNLLTNSLKKI